MKSPGPYSSESLYQLLSQTSPENMHRNVAQYGLDPATRYPNLNLRAVTVNQVRSLGGLHWTSQGNFSTPIFPFLQLDFAPLVCGPCA